MGWKLHGITSCGKNLLSQSVLPPLSVRNGVYHVVIQQKNYHNKSAVFGYRPKNVTYFALHEDAIKAQCEENKLYQLICAYREHGHKFSNINPIDFSNKIKRVPELDPSRYGLTNDKTYHFTGLLSTPQIKGTLSDALNFLQNVYCGNIGGEFMFLQNEEEKIWFACRLEEIKNEPVDPEFEKAVCIEMLKCQAFDDFMAKKFVSLKRYGAEGAESIMAFFLQFFKSCIKGGVTELVIGMPHRGRLNLLINLLHLQPELLFHKLRGKSEFPDQVKASGDVISHLVTSTDVDVNGQPLRVTSLHNPSHLEAVNPVSLGKTRCRHLELGEGEYGITAWSDQVLNLQVHGDGALSGQGINQETLLLGRLPHYEVGGSVHLVVNNQLAFTTPPERSRGTPYCTDIAKLISAPVLHVNGDIPQDVIKATQLVTEYQRKFRKDVFLDLNCYRRRGHNELDDPTFTNPKLYKLISKQKTVPDQFAAELKARGLLTSNEMEENIASYTSWLNDSLQRSKSYVPQESFFGLQWSGFKQAPAALTHWDTWSDLNLLKYIATKSVTVPQHFNIHATLLKHHVNGRLKRINEGSEIDWSTAEAMAWGSLLYEGYNVRISGQDVGRGTFSHRHAMLVDQLTNDIYIPLNHLADGQAGFLEVANSHLSEEAVLGFEYGMSIESPKNLCLWEAQFGDFANGAQIQIDTFISSGEMKWMRCSGLVMLLPHGYDGAGPEHSSCRLERFLQLTDSSETAVDGEHVNIHIVNPTTPAQYFHLLRRQMVRNYRKPLIVVAPKILLRDPEATSSLQLFAPGSKFTPVIGDHTIKSPEGVSKVLLVTGKHYYSLRRQRDALGINNVPIIRLEELCPFPMLYLQSEIEKYPKANHFIWCQEEHQNMGAWTFCKPRFENMLGKKLKYCGRGPLAAPAVGVGEVHRQEAEQVVNTPFVL